MNEPTPLKRRLKVPERCTTEFGPPSSKVTLCGLRPVHVHVTVAVLDESRATVTAPGLKKLSPIATAAVVTARRLAILAPHRVSPIIIGPVEEQHVFANSALAVTNEVSCTDAPIRLDVSFCPPRSTPAPERMGRSREAEPSSGVAFTSRLEIPAFGSPTRRIGVWASSASGAAPGSTSRRGRPRARSGIAAMRGRGTTVQWGLRVWSSQPQLTTCISSGIPETSENCVAVCTCCDPAPTRHVRSSLRCYEPRGTM